MYCTTYLSSRWLATVETCTGCNHWMALRTAWSQSPHDSSWRPPLPHRSMPNTSVNANSLSDEVNIFLTMYSTCQVVDHQSRSFLCHVYVFFGETHKRMRCERYPQKLRAITKLQCGLICICVVMLVGFIYDARLDVRTAMLCTYNLP